MAEHCFICDFDGAQFVEGVYCIHNAQLGVTRNGKNFLKALIRDKSGELTARMWNVTDELFQSLPTDGFVFLQGQTQPYQGELQLIIQNIRLAEVTEDDLQILLPATDRDINEMFGEVRTILETLEHPAMRALAETYLEDDELMAAFRISPAAVSLHHAYLGGLLEHTLQLMNLATVMLPLYPSLNRDLIIMGLFLHDLCKCQELSFERGFAYTDEGQLLGHLVMGAILLKQKAADAAAMSGERLPGDALLVLQHIIVSHHGRPEYGAAKTPSTPEAVFVSRLDELDAKVEMACCAAKVGRDGIERELGGNFSEKVWALETRIFRPDPLTAPEAEE
ncbi:MAG: 3'-5' exoribonuclease YhaM family protein [Phycisphaerales bacterium]